MLPKQLKDSQRHQRQPKQVELFLQRECCKYKKIKSKYNRSTREKMIRATTARKFVYMITPKQCTCDWLGTLRDGMLAVEDIRKKSAEELTGNWLKLVFVGPLFTPKYWELEPLTEAIRQNQTENGSQELVLVQFGSSFFWFWELDFETLGW